MSKNLEALAAQFPEHTAQIAAMSKNLETLAKQFPDYTNQILRSNAALHKKIPGVVKLTGAAAAGAGINDGVQAGVSYLSNRDANKAHAAGNDAAKEGELAE